MRSSREVPRSLKSAAGISMEDFNRAMAKWLRKIYWPGVVDYETPEDIAERVTNHRKIGNYVNNGGALSPDGQKIAFLSDRADYFDVWLHDLETNKSHRLLQGERSGNFEQLKWLDARMSWSPDGENIVFASKAGALDAINILDVEKAGYCQTISTKTRRDIQSDVVTGRIEAHRVRGNEDRPIRLVLLRTRIRRHLCKLTDDIFSDDDPAWGADSHDALFCV